MENGNAVLDCSYTFWVQSEALNTTSGVVLFHQELGVPIVNSNFQYYRDAFSFTLAVRWDVDVARFDLVPEQSQVAFAFVDAVKRPKQSFAEVIRARRGISVRPKVAWARRRRLANTGTGTGALMHPHNMHSPRPTSARSGNKWVCRRGRSS